MWKKERPGAERFVIGTSGSVMVTALSHQGWGMMKQNVFREPWAARASPGWWQQALGPCWEGAAGPLTWDSNSFSWHQSSDSRMIPSAAAAISGSGAPPLCQLCLSSHLEIKLPHHFPPQVILSSAQCTASSGLAGLYQRRLPVSW